MEWIKVDYTTAIPKDQDILVCIEFTRKVTILQFTGVGWREPITGHMMRVPCTHFMPLPKPPKE